MAIVLNNLSGGLNVYDPPTDLPEDQVVEAYNVLWTTARVAVRRLGTLTASGWNAVGPITFVDHGHRHLPNGNAADSELYLVVASGGSIRPLVADGVWTLLNPPDAINEGFTVNTASAHQKCFIAYQSNVARLHIQAANEDPSTPAYTVRRTGLPQPDAITSVTGSGSGGYTGVRYFRYRYIYENGGTIWRRSEPSDVTTFTPATPAGANITIPSPPANETITDWELEASDDNADFYRILTQDISDLTYTDTTNPATQYAVNGVLSEQIGDYDLQWDAEFLVVDQDRMVIGGTFSNDVELQNRVGWSPVYAEPGVGNDERIPQDPVSIVDLDAGNGGRMTGMVGPVNGVIYCGKNEQIFKLLRTNNRQQAYISQPVSKTVGCLRGSMVEGVDETGAACVYFLDPNVGAYRIGQFGLQYCGTDIFPIWETVNVNAGFVCEPFFDPVTVQVSWAVATGVSTVPNLRLVLNTEHARTTENGDVRRGWAIYNGQMGTTRSSFRYAADINASTRSAALVPFHGFADVTNQNTLQQGEIGNSDNGEAYVASVVTRPIIAMQTTLQKTGATTAMVIAPPSSGATVAIGVSVDFDLWDVVKNIDLTFEGREITRTPSRVLRFLDNLSIADARVLQWSISDADESPNHAWAIDRIDVGVRKEESLS